MENTCEEGQLLAEFRKLPAHQRQELIATAKGLAASRPSSSKATVPSGQCAIKRRPSCTPMDNDNLVTE